MAKLDFVRLLVRLYGDPALGERLKNDPRSVARAAKLSAAERELLVSRDERATRRYLGAEIPLPHIIGTAIRPGSRARDARRRRITARHGAPAPAAVRQ